MWVLAEGVRGEEESVSIDSFDMIISDSQQKQSDSTIVYVNKHLSAKTTQVTLGDLYGNRVDFT